MRFTTSPDAKKSDLNRHNPFLLLSALIAILGGCAMIPDHLYVKTISGSFASGTIVCAHTGSTVSFAALLADINTANVIYVGENHREMSHHEIQLKIIKAVFAHHPTLAVGLEMFDHSYQEVLDRWSAGELDEKTFLRKTHWYANWRYDFSLYRDILNFVKDNHIRLVGLNIPFHIPAKIRVGGIEHLSAEEKSHLPQKIDTSDAAHKRYVQDIYNQHHFVGEADFDDFYVAQCVWEDAMAQAVTENLDSNVMVVLAGNGHIQFKYGIPDRAYRLSGADFRTIYPARAGSEIELDIADYIWVTP